MIDQLGVEAKYWFLCGALTLLVFCWFLTIDISHVPAFSSILSCMPENVHVIYLYKAILSVNAIFPVFLAFFLSPTDVFSEIKHLFSSALTFIVALMGLYIGVPLQRVDGAAVVFSNLFCESILGAVFVMLMIGTGTFFCILYFLYSCKSIYLLKIRGA